MTRNVVNTDEIDSFVTDLERRSPYPEVRAWLRATYRKWLIKHAATGTEIVRTPADVNWTTDPLLARDEQTGQLSAYAGPRAAWLDGALDRGDRVFSVDCGHHVERDAWLVIDWLNAQHDGPVFSRLSRISYPQGLAAARDWQMRLALQRTVEEQAGDTQLEQQFGDGYRMVRLKTPRALEIEGTRMGHCVASYDDDLTRGTVILSLRDPENRPHCTMELFERSVYQIKGKQNRPPVARYRPYIRQYIALRRYKVVDDIDNAGVLLYANDRPCRDVNVYVRVLAAHGGLDPWDRRRDYPFDNWVDLAPLRSIARLADELDDDTRELLFRALARGFDAGVRFTPAATLNAFGIPFHYVFADYPFALYYLRRKGVFPGSGYGRRINTIIDRAIGRLLAKADERPDWLFGVKMREYEDAGDDPWDCDILTASRMDFRQIRHCRHMRLRRRIAEIRREVRPLLRDPTVSATLRDGWHRDWLEIQRVLDSRAGEFL